MAEKFIEPGHRFMDVVWMRDHENIYTGEAVVLACLLALKKERTAKQEEELKEVLGVFDTTPVKRRKS